MTPVVALISTVTSGVVAGGSAVFAAASSSPDATSIAPYLSGGGTLALTGVFGLLLKKVLDGTLVVRSVEEQEKEWSASFHATVEREESLQRIVEEVRREITSARDQMARIERQLERMEDRR